MSRDKIVNIKVTMPEEKRVTKEEYPSICAEAIEEGYYLPPWDVLNERMTNANEAVVVRSTGHCEVEYASGKKYYSEIRRWFIHDNASVPKFGRWFLDNDEKAMKIPAMFFHDPAYWCHWNHYGREEANKMFGDMMEYYGKSRLTALFVRATFNTKTANRAYNASGNYISVMRKVCAVEKVG